MYNIGLEVLTTGMSIDQLTDFSNDLSNKFENLINLIKTHESIRKYGNTAQLQELMAPALEGVIINISNQSLETIKNTITSVVKYIVDKLNQFGRFIASIFKDLMNTISNNISSLKKTIGNMVTKNVSFTVNMYPIEKINTAIGKARTITGLLNDIYKAMNQVHTEDTVAIMTNLKDSLFGNVDELKELLENLVKEEQTSSLKDSKTFLLTHESNYNLIKKLTSESCTLSGQLKSVIQKYITQQDSSLATTDSTQYFLKKLEIAKDCVDYFTKSTRMCFYIGEKISTNLTNMAAAIEKVI